MTTLLLLLQLAFFARPVASAYAAQVKHDVVVSVTFADVRPTKVCTSLYMMDDTTFGYPVDTHCWTPKTDIGSLDVWPNLRLDDGNFKVVIIYASRPVDTFYLTTKVNS